MESVGTELQRIDFPVGGAEVFVYIFFGIGARQQAVARAIVERAELTWTNEPFAAKR